MVSALTTKGSEEALRSLELGAVDIVEKPKLDVKEGLEEISIQICDKIKAAAQARVKTPRQRFFTPTKKFSVDEILDIHIERIFSISGHIPSVFFYFIHD